jgi:hypothetical protein
MERTDNPAHVFMVLQPQSGSFWQNQGGNGGWIWTESANFMTDNSGPPNQYKPTGTPLTRAIHNHWIQYFKNSKRKKPGFDPKRFGIYAADYLDGGNHAGMVWATLTHSNTGALNWTYNTISDDRGIGNIIEAFALR